jgi:hypothetical protein
MARYLHRRLATFGKGRMTQRRPRLQPRVTIDDLASAYDRGANGKPVRPAIRRPAAVPSARPRGLTASQGDIRLARLKARADGIRFALQYENQTVAQSKVLRQILQNLELAIRGMEMTLNES